MNKPKKRFYRHLNQADRDRIQALLDNGHQQKDIAKVLKVAKSTISREIKRNRRYKRKKGRCVAGPYEAAVAQHKAYVARKYAKYQGKKIFENERLRRYISRKLQRYWSPDEISGRMKKECQFFYASKNTIYEWLYNTLDGHLHCQYLYSRRHQVKKRKAAKSKKTVIPNRISIHERPKEYVNQFKHYEGDTFVSPRKSRSKHAVAVAYERQAKYTDFRKLTSMKPKQFSQAMRDIKSVLIMESITFDNGIENRDHETLGLETYFCDPYSSWQKGGVEKTIQMTRRFIPKGTDLRSVSQDTLDAVADILNNKPRKSLGYKTPYEVMIENDLFLIENKKAEMPVALRG